MLSEVFYWLFNMSISASVVGTVILLLGKIQKLPRRLVHVLWAIPALRMWIPVGVSSKYGLMALISKLTTKTFVVYEGALDFTIMNHVMAAEKYSPITFKVNLLDSLFRAASIVWIFVAAVLILLFAVLYVHAISELRDASHVRDNIYISDRITSPATYGVFHPRIILPKGYEQNNLQYILDHEMAHIRRRDNLWRFLAIVSSCVHWFNPLAWLFLKSFLEVTELACDERVLADYGEEGKKAYATALVDCAESRNAFASAFGGAKLHLRMEYILSYRKLSILSMIGFILLAIAIGYVLLTNAQSTIH